MHRVAEWAKVNQHKVQNSKQQMLVILGPDPPCQAHCLRKLGNSHGRCTKWFNILPNSSNPVSPQWQWCHPDLSSCASSAVPRAWPQVPMSTKVNYENKWYCYMEDIAEAIDNLLTEIYSWGENMYV